MPGGSLQTPRTKHMSSRTSVDLSFKCGEFLILGTEIRVRDEKRRFHYYELHHAQKRHIVDAQFRKRR